ncbi:MAG: hypothetical protein ACKVX7_06385 [Planctomycetota bacterium]
MASAVVLGLPLTLTAQSPITDISCFPIAGTLINILSWTNNGPYDEIDVTLDGALVATLSGSAVSTSLAALPGAQVICVIPVVGGFGLGATCCGPVTGLVCSPQASGEVQLNWLLNGDYSSIEIFIDGASSALLPGSAIDTLTPILSAGDHEVCVMPIGGGSMPGFPYVETCCIVTVSTAMPPAFTRADCNDDGSSNVADSVALLLTLFVPGTADVPCADACDANDDGGLDIADAIFTLAWLFVGGPAPAPPLACGVDGTADGLDCASVASCP